MVWDPSGQDWPFMVRGHTLFGGTKISLRHPIRQTRPVCPTCPPHPPDLPNVTQLSHASQAQASHQTRLGFILGPILGFILGGPCLPTEVSFQGHNFPQLPAAPPPDAVITANWRLPYQIAPSRSSSSTFPGRGKNCNLPIAIPNRSSPQRLPRTRL